MKTLVLANHKGGVGKSAVATLLAHYFAAQAARPGDRPRPSGQLRDAAALCPSARPSRR